MISEMTNQGENTNTAQQKGRTGGLIAVSVAYIMMILLLMYPRTVAEATQAALQQWYRNVVPALFPFMMLMPMITGREAAYIYEKIFGRVMGKLLRLPGGAVPAIIAGAIAGSPAGAIAAGKAAESAGMSKKELLRIAGCVSGFSPAFLISGIGAGMMGDNSSGTLLLKTQLITQGIMLLFTGRHSHGAAILVETREENAAAAAVLPILTVAGYMVFFSVMSSLLTQFSGKTAINGLICILEATQGAAYIARAGLKYELTMVILAAVCGFGGISIFVQNMKILTKYGILPQEFLIWRIVSASLSMIVMLALMRYKGCSNQINRPDWMNLAAFCVITLAIPAIIGLKKSIS